MNKEAYLIDTPEKLAGGYFAYEFYTQADAQDFYDKLKATLPSDPIVGQWKVGKYNPAYDSKVPAGNHNPKFIPV